MTHVTEEQLVAYALDDAEEGTRGEIETHVAACRECREALEELRRILVAASEREGPERAGNYGAEVWARLEPRLSDRHARVVSWRPWLAAAAVLVLTVGAFLIGRWWPPPQGPATVATGAP